MLIVDNFWLLFLFSVLWIIALGVFAHFKMKRSGFKIPKPTEPGTLFVERFASGHSGKSWITKLGGASNCLTVYFNEDVLVVTSFFPFKQLLPYYDLHHVIPLLDITSIDNKGRNLIIDFNRSGGKRGRLSLIMRKKPEFYQAMIQHLSAEQSN